MSYIPRRNFLKMLFICLASLLFSITGYAFPLILPKRQERQEFGFNEFYLLSQLITKTRNLNKVVANKIYELIMSESWGLEHLSQVYSTIRKLQIQTEGALTIKASVFTRNEQWFISHLMLTWYTGVYFHESGNFNVTLQHALMYQNISQYRQPPTFCSGAPGSWSEPPVPQA